MDIKILHMVEGAKQARGVAVVIDVFRAFTVEAYLAKNGAEKIIPVAKTETAFELKAQDPSTVLIGERNGVKIEGFDFGNSPSAIQNVDFHGKVVVHTTSAGTQGLANAGGAAEVLTGSLVNAEAIARYIKSRGYKQVSLVCMGLRAVSQTEEDNLCAEYIKSLLEGKPIEMESRVKNLAKTSGAKFFDRAQQSVFPQKDFELCTELNKFNFVLRLKKTDGGIDYIERIDV